LKTYDPEENKEEKVINQHIYPFCPLCLGVREPIHNLLEVGSTIKEIVVKENEKDSAISVSDGKEWFESRVEEVLCFGCKRMVLSAVKRRELMELMPRVVVENGKRV
jgi:hypothetical protein